MDWEQALRQRLIDDPAVTAGAGYGPRPQAGDLPWISLQVVSDPRPQTLAGFYPNRESRVQIDVRGLRRSDVVDQREAAIAALAPAGTFSGVTFGRANFSPVRDLGEQTETGFIHRDSFDVLVWHD